MQVHGNTAVPISARVIGNPTKLPIVIAEVHNPESTLVKSLKEYYGKLGFDQLYDFFGHIRVTTIHPFAIFLFQDVGGQPVDLSLLPSVCIADSTDTESQLTLGHEEISFNITEAVYSAFQAYIAAKTLVTSNQNMQRLRAALDTGVMISGMRRTYIADHVMDFNIWSDNKDITSIVYDATKLFALNEMVHLRENGIDVVGGVSGRRSGDINIEFGRLLYGANITVSVKITTSVIEISLEQVPDKLVLRPIYHEAGGQ